MVYEVIIVFVNFPRLQRSGVEADHSLPTTVEFKNAWNRSSPPKTSSRGRALIVPRDALTYNVPSC